MSACTQVPPSESGHGVLIMAMVRFHSSYEGVKILRGASRAGARAGGQGRRGGRG